jgi:putative peptidoglycan lipid II flippase
MTHIARSSLIVAVFFGLDKILGFGRQVLIAHQFGLTYLIDVFNAANNIPDLLSALISGGALGVALIPVLSEYLEKRGRPASWDLFSHIVNLAFLVTAAISILIISLAGPLVRNVIAPGFPSEQQALTIELMRLDLLAILIFSISGLVMAGLQANQHFLLPAMAPGLSNIGQIFGVAILAPAAGLSLGPIQLPAFNLGIHGLVYGVILGALLHLGIQVPGLVHFGFRWAPAIDLRNPGVRQVLNLMGPRVLTMFFLQMFFIARDNLASGLGEGAVTALNYGWFIMQVPETLIGTALAIALLPTLAEHFALKEMELFTDTLHRAIRIILALTLPAASLLWVALRPLIPAIFAFESQGAELVLWATRVYLLGLVGHSLLETASRSFYAQQDARTPLYVAALNAAAYVVFAVSLSRWLGAVGIALANTLAFTGEALLLLFLLNRRLRRPSLSAQIPAEFTPSGLLRVGNTVLRVALACLLGGLAAALVEQLPLPRLVSGLGALAGGGLVVLPFIWPELKILIKL